MADSDQPRDGDFSLEMMITPEFQSDHRSDETRHPRAGDLCPQCQSAKLDYDGLLNLGCPACGYVLAGCFT